MSSSSSRLNSISFSSKHSIISLSNFDTISSHNNNQFVSYNNSNNNNKTFYNEKQPTNTTTSDIKFDRTIDQAVDYFEQILTQCVTPSNTSLIKDNEQQDRKNDIKIKIETKKRDCEEFLNSLNKTTNFKMKQRNQKIDCRKWCDEQNRRITKSYNSIDDNNNRKYRSKNRNIYGSIFYCRKALLQKSDGITYICIRKRFN
ncbi:unnamed protein product [Rotaria sordida]|uniref:Uncharacterized protein n=1 Tax=Rotaria sordida TaxID=392033 RepID=A0A814LNF2_9BILA|nr:unnamed protein product [Rotaria sordida]CAF3639633.1 unnamed protein product [Rotaria sordida]